MIDPRPGRGGFGGGGFGFGGGRGRLLDGILDAGINSLRWNTRMAANSVVRTAVGEVTGEVNYAIRRGVHNGVGGALGNHGGYYHQERRGFLRNRNHEDYDDHPRGFAAFLPNGGRGPSYHDRMAGQPVENLMSFDDFVRDIQAQRVTAMAQLSEKYGLADTTKQAELQAQMDRLAALESDPKNMSRLVIQYLGTDSAKYLLGKSGENGTDALKIKAGQGEVDAVITEVRQRTAAADGGNRARGASVTTSQSDSLAAQIDGCALRKADGRISTFEIRQFAKQTGHSVEDIKEALQREGVQYAGGQPASQQFAGAHRAIRPSVRES